MLTLLNVSVKSSPGSRLLIRFETNNINEHKIVGSQRLAGALAIKCFSYDNN